MIPFIHVMSAYSMPGTISAIRSKIVDKTEKKFSFHMCKCSNSVDSYFKTVYAL